MYADVRVIHIFVISGCPPNFKPVGTGCYRIMNTLKRRPQAMQSCEAMASHLIDFDNEEEQSVIEQLGKYLCKKKIKQNQHVSCNMTNAVNFYSIAITIDHNKYEQPLHDFGC